MNILGCTEARETQHEPMIPKAALIGVTAKLVWWRVKAGEELTVLEGATEGNGCEDNSSVHMAPGNQGSAKQGSPGECGRES